MKFTLAWAKVAAQNVTLKVATILLAIVSIIQLIVIAELNMKDPIVIERSCFSKLANLKSAEHTQEEIKAFLGESLAMRFDTKINIKESFLSIEEMASRNNEQLLLSQKQIIQKILINNIAVSDKEIVLDADRLISVGKVKSVLAFPLQVFVKSTNRSELNPYGLVLTQVSQIQEKVQE